MDPSTMSAALLKDPKFMELFQRALGEGAKIPDEKDPNRDAWLKDMQAKLAAEAQKEAKAQLEQPVSDKDGQWMYIIPEPGFCIKCGAVKGKSKYFINVCKHERIAEPIPLEPDEQEEDDAIKFKIPLSCSQGRIDTDKSGQPCKVYDVIVNPNTIQRCSEDAEFRRFVAALCMTWIKQKSEPDLNADEFKNLNFKAKGTLEAQRIRLSQAPKPANAMGDEIKLPSQNAPTAPSAVGGSGSGKPLIQEMDGLPAKTQTQPAAPPKPEVVHTLVAEGSYDWSAHKRPTRHPHFRENVPKSFFLTVTIPNILTINEVEVQVQAGRSVELTFVDEEQPFLKVPLPYAVNDSPTTAKFVKSKKELRLGFDVQLSDESEDSQKTKPCRDAEEIEREEQAKAQAELDEKLRQQRERYEKIRKEEADVFSQRKEFVENLAAMQEGAIPPVMKEEFDGMQPEQQRAMLMRIEGRIRRGDSVDQLLDKLGDDMLLSICKYLRDKLGLEQLAPPAKASSSVEKKPKSVQFNEAANTTHPAPTGNPTDPQPALQPGENAWEAKLKDSLDNVEYNFAKKAEKLFGVLMNNRYLFALDH